MADLMADPFTSEHRRTLERLYAHQGSRIYPEAVAIRAALAELDRLREEHDALLSQLVGLWPGGGWVARLPWRHEGYAGGTWSEGTAWWFESREAAEAAVLVAALSPAGREEPLTVPARPACPQCLGPTIDRGAAVWCERCGKVETCCDGGDMGTRGRPGP